MNIFWEHTIKTLTVNVTRDSMRRFLREDDGVEPSEEEVEGLIEFASDPTRYKIQVNKNEPIRQTLQMIPGLANILAARKWQLLRTTAGAFVTSDAPVVTWTHPRDRHPLHGVGFGTADEVAFAIDCHHALVFAWEAPAGEVLRDVGIEHVRVLNGRTAASARRWIIHHPGDSPLLGMVLPKARPKILISPPPQRFVPEGL